jgi:hypothetical protein
MVGSSKAVFNLLIESIISLFIKSKNENHENPHQQAAPKQLCHPGITGST